MNKCGFTNNEVQRITIDLTGYCNMNCCLCLKHFRKTSHPNGILDINQWKNVLDNYPNCQLIIFAGSLSEPTLYKQFFELLDYIKQRNICIDLYTNGNTHDEAWWKELKNHLNSNDKCIFTVCGSTQELHQVYRVGSDLKRMLNNAMAFKSDKKNDYCQHILFEYNKDDFKNMQPIFDMFSNTIKIFTDARYEFNSIFDKASITKEMKNNKIYLPLDKHIIMTNIYMKLYAIKDYIHKQGNFNVKCDEYYNKEIYLDSLGNVYPCPKFYFYANENDKFDPTDFSKILNFKYDFCIQCESHFLNMLSKYNLSELDG